MSLFAKLRRIALNQQGLLQADSFGRGKPGTLRAIEHLGYVQIDTISVVARAHHHVLWSRVPNYQPRFLDQLVRQRKVFEYWSHAAAWLPMRDYRFALPRMAQLNGERNWFEHCDPALSREILLRIESEGALRTRDFEDSRKGKKQWWDWKPAKQALEQLFMQGELMVSGREGFQKVYDLPQRVLPEWVDTRLPSMEEYADHLIDASMRAHGFATQTFITYLRKGRKLRETVNRQLLGRVESGQLTRLQTAGKQAVYIDPELLDSRAPRSFSRVRILSPFDNLVIQRQRGRELFDFDYQIECYLPEAKRRFGYFCLPLLYRDRLVGRIDCKAHRQQKCLEVKSLNIGARLDDAFLGSLCQSLRSFARFNQCEQVRFSAGSSDALLKSVETKFEATQ